MSAREEATRAALDGLLAAANVEPKGIAAHTALTMAAPIDLHHQIVLGVLDTTAGNLDIVFAVQAIRRLPPGAYRAGLVIMPEYVPNLIVPAKQVPVILPVAHHLKKRS